MPLLLMLMCGALSAPAPTEPSASAETQPAALPAAPAPLRVELQPRDDGESARLRAGQEAIEKALAENPTGLARAELLLRRANWLISIDGEASASLFLHGAAKADDVGRWAEVLRRAEADLTAARRLIDEAAEPTDERQEARLEELNRAAGLLGAFTSVLRGLCVERIEDPEALYASAADLSPYLDDEERSISRAANLWQAVVLRKIGRAGRALDYLEPPLTAPGKAAVGLFIRWERLRCLAADDRLAAALALAVRMEERCFSWFADEAKRDAAVNGCALLRLGLYEQYHRRLVDENRSEEAAVCARMIERIRGERVPESGTMQVARLRRVLPLLLEAEDPLAEPDEAAIELKRDDAEEAGADDEEADEGGDEEEAPFMDEGGADDEEPEPEPEAEDEHPGRP